MLVCSVSLRPQRHVIAANIVEAGAALDDPALGVIFATLTDDPGNALDVLNAFVGSNITEAASAAAVVNAGAVLKAAIVEETGAIASPGATVIDSSGGIPAAMAEAATANSVLDATITSGTATAAIDGTFVTSTTASTVLGTEIIDSGPIAPFD